MRFMAQGPSRLGQHAMRSLNAGECDAYGSLTNTWVTQTKMRRSHKSGSAAFAGQVLLLELFYNLILP